VVEDRRGQGLRRAGVADERAETLARETLRSQVDTAFEELGRAQEMADTILLVRGQPRRRDRAARPVRRTVGRGADRIGAEARFAVAAVADRVRMRCVRAQT